MANEFKVKKGLIVDGSNTVLDIQGTQGQLFSVTDSLTGDLFSVSDISGIPILNVNSSGVVSIEGAQVPTGTGTANKLTKWNSAGTGLEDTNISVVVSGATRQYTINGGQTGSGINLLTLNKDTGGASDRSMMFRIGTTQNDIVSDANYDTGELRFRLTLADGTETSILVLNSAGNVTMPGYSTGYLKTNSNGAITADNSTFSTASGVADNADVTPSWVPATDPGYSTLAIGTTSTTALAGNTTIPSGNAVIDWTAANAGTIHTSNYIENVDYELPTAAANTLGGVKVGSNLSISAAGVLSAASETYTAHESITEATSNLNNSGRTYIQDITLDGNGHVTGVATATETVTNTDTNTNILSGGTITGDVTVNGDMTFQDDHKINFGTGQTEHASIYHNGNTLYFDNDDGHMYIRNNVDGDDGSNIYIQAKSGEQAIKANDDGSVVLYYDNGTKFSTSQSGVTVTGSMYATSAIGNLGTGIGQQLEYGNSSVATLRSDADRWRVYMGGGSSAGEKFCVTETGRVGINDSSPDYPLDVSGNVSSISIYASHDIAAYSDARVKGDIKTIPDALDKVNKLRGVTFVRTDEGASDKRMMGVIAQEVKDIVPEVVTKKESDGHYAVSYGNMVGLLIESIKELTAEVESLKKQIDGGTK